MSLDFYLSIDIQYISLHLYVIFQSKHLEKPQPNKETNPPKNYNECMPSPAKLSFLGTISQAVTLSSSSVTDVILGHLMGFFP